MLVIGKLIRNALLEITGTLVIAVQVVAGLRLVVEKRASGAAHPGQDSSKPSETLFAVRPGCTKLAVKV